MTLLVQDGPAGSEVWALANPRRKNAVTPEALDDITRRCASLRGQVVVLRGTEGGPFCAGFDLTRLDSASPSAPPDLPLMRATAAMEAADATFVAVIQDYAIGAGVELTCACDLVIADSESFFQVPAGRLGVVYHDAGLRRMERRFGPRLLRAMLLLGRRVPAPEAAAAGAVDELASPGTLDRALTDVLDALADGAAQSRAAHRAWLRARRHLAPQAPPHPEHEARRAAAYARLARAREGGES